MPHSREPQNLEQLLDRIAEAAQGEEQVSLDMILDEVGRRSFGPLLLVAGLVTVAPLVGDIPGVPTLMALLVLLTATQVLFRHDHIWLPKWMLRRSIEREKLEKALGWLRRPACFVDRLLRPRLTPLANHAGAYAIAVICTLIALATPLTEVIPFSANAVGAVLVIFGLSLIARDGLLALVAFVLTGATAGLVVYHFWPGSG